jgi:hypothetical protein
MALLLLGLKLAAEHMAGTFSSQISVINLRSHTLRRRSGAPLTERSRVPSRENASATTSTSAASSRVKSCLRPG